MLLLPFSQLQQKLWINQGTISETLFFCFEFNPVLSYVIVQCSFILILTVSSLKICLWISNISV